MKYNVHILSEMIVEKDNSFINIHEINVDDDNDNIEITYDVVIPAKKIIISKKEYLRYSREGKINNLLNSEED